MFSGKFFFIILKYDIYDLIVAKLNIYEVILHIQKRQSLNYLSKLNFKRTFIKTLFLKIAHAVTLKVIDRFGSNFLSNIIIRRMYREF